MQEGSTEAILDASKAITKAPTDLKCGCCARAAKTVEFSETTERVLVFERACQCWIKATCYICSWCIDHCKCGQKVATD